MVNNPSCVESEASALWRAIARLSRAESDDEKAHQIAAIMTLAQHAGAPRVRQKAAEFLAFRCGIVVGSPVETYGSQSDTVAIQDRQPC
jgi:hypothetical protein